MIIKYIFEKYSLFPNIVNVAYLNINVLISNKVIYFWGVFKIIFYILKSLQHFYISLAQFV